jgi:uncharacterized protein (TIGR02147 family)
MNIFELSDYREILRSTLLQKKRAIKQFSFQNMARACKVQKAYLSKVLRGRAQLSDDQVFLACAYLNFSDLETEYIRLLHARARCSVRSREEWLDQEIKRVVQRALRTESHVSAPAVTPNESALRDYYSDPSIAIVHMFLTVARYAKNVAQIARELGLRDEVLAAHMRTLEKLGFIDLRNDTYEVVTEHLHLPQSASYFDSQRTMMRIKSLEHLQRKADGAAYCFTVTLSGDEQMRATLRKMFLDYLKNAEKVVRAAPPKDVYQMNFDLFSWNSN